MTGPSSPIRVPDLTERRFGLTVERDLGVPAAALYAAWTRHFDRWFAAPGSVLMRAAVDEPFFFETEYRLADDAKVRRHPHYGRFLRLVPDALVELTWVTGAGGTEGAETVVTVALTPRDGSTHLALTHAGFASEAARDRHRQAWPLVLSELERRLGSVPDR